MKTLVIAIALAVTPLAAQWLNHPTPGIPRTKDGKANLSAPAPRTRDGKPDFSGTWSAPGFSTKYLEHWPADRGGFQMLPCGGALYGAGALYQERLADAGKNRPSTRCLPHSVTDFDAHHMPKKVLQTDREIAMLF